MKKEERLARQKRLARAIQVREAQRRRRARLKNENQKFLQIIVPDALRELIFDYGTLNGLTLQEAAVVLIEKGLELQSSMVSAMTMPTESTRSSTISGESDRGRRMAPEHEEPEFFASTVNPTEPPVSVTVVASVAAPAEAQKDEAPDPDWDVNADDGQLSLF